MKILLPLALLLTHASAFAATCPTLVREPKRLTCQTKMNYYGLPFTSPLVIDLQPDGYQNWKGKVDFQYPGVGNGDGSPNTLSAQVHIETHGNGQCQQWDEYELDLNVLSNKVSGTGKSVNLTMTDGLGNQALSVQLNCSVQ